MSKYDRQLLIAFLTGRDDDAVWDNIDSIQSKFFNDPFGANKEKGKTNLVPFTALSDEESQIFNWKQLARLPEEFAKLTDNSRVYIVGHGNWQEQRIGNYDGKFVAHLLWAHGLGKHDHITVVACEGARSTSDHTGQRLEGGITTSTESFASKLHYHLGVSHQIRTVVFGYIYSVKTYKVGTSREGKKLVVLDGSEVGILRKDAPNSKRRFYWLGKSQFCEWV